MPQTIQPYSVTLIQEAQKWDTPLPETETEDALSLLLSIFDSLNKLSDRLSALDYAMKRKLMEIEINNIRKERGKGK